MKLKILSMEGTGTREAQLPTQFEEAVRPDLIQKAVLCLQSRRRQPYGSDPGAGKKASAKLSKRRRKYRGTYGIGQSRTPRQVMSHRGSRFNYRGAFAPQTVGGRRAHPPKAEKIWEQKINEKENRKAIRSAMKASVIKELVKARGHLVPDKYPFIIEDKVQDIAKTKHLKEALVKLGFDKELARAEKKTIRAGKGKMRGRKYVRKKSLLFVVAQDCALKQAAKSVPGIEVVEVNALNAELLAPGCHVGRATLYTESAIKRLEAEKLFTKDYKGPKVEKKAKPVKEAKVEKKPVKKTAPPKEAKVTQPKAKEEKKKETKHKAVPKPAPSAEKKEEKKPEVKVEVKEAKE
ncbi:MAG: 50S ribosomal protein L4 [archaeon]